MSVVAAIRDMLAKGVSIEQALSAAELVESREEARRLRKKAKAEADAEKEKARKRQMNAARQQSWRERHPDRATPRNAEVTHVTQNNADNALCALPPLKQKEPFPPTPPLLEKLNSPIYRDADASLVNGTPLTCELSPQKNMEAIEKLRQFGESWNVLARQMHFPQIDEIKPGSTRQRHALARLREMAPDGVQGLMTRIRGSPYLRGEVNGFRVSFDWIINPSNYQKIMEGNYEVRKTGALNRSGSTARVL